MGLKEQVDELRKITDELMRHAGTNEQHLIAKMSERMYHLAVEVKRLDDNLDLLIRAKRIR